MFIPTRKAIFHIVAIGNSETAYHSGEKLLLYQTSTTLIIKDFLMMDMGKGISSKKDIL